MNSLTNQPAEGRESGFLTAGTVHFAQGEGEEYVMMSSSCLFFRRMEMPNSVHSRHRLITLILCCVNIRADREKLWRARRITPEFCRGNIGYVNLHQPEDVLQVTRNFSRNEDLILARKLQSQVKCWEAAHFTLVLLFNLCLITWGFCYMYR